MNPKVKETLDKILLKTLEELSEDDKAFLRARSSLLTIDQKSAYKSILKPKKAKKANKKTQH